MLQCNAAILSKHIPFHGKFVAEGVESVRILEKLGKAVLCALLVLALLGAAAGAETLRVGVRDDIINFGFYNETTGKYYGLEIDLAAELAQRIGYDDVEYITVMPDTRKDMLLNGEVDVVIATYSIAESREENFDFSAPYYEDDTIIMVEKSTLFGSIRDLKDKNIGIVNGTNAGPLLAQKLYDEGIITDVVVENTDTFTQYEGAYVTKTERYEDLDALLETGEIDAACMDACIAQTYMNDQREFLDVLHRPSGIRRGHGEGFRPQRARRGGRAGHVGRRHHRTAHRQMELGRGSERDCETEAQSGDHDRRGTDLSFPGRRAADQYADRPLPQ